MSELPVLPASWSWTEFSEIAAVESNLVDPTVHPDSPHIAPNHIESATGRILPYQTVSEDRVTSPKHLFYPGQVLYSKIRPYLAKAVLVDFHGLCSADMYPVQSHISVGFLHKWLISPMFTAHASTSQGRTVLPKINQKALATKPVPVAPLNEQRRIVAKIEALQARSDAAKQALDAIPPLLESLRQSVLAAAFRGDLTRTWREQNPDVEPASVLLERIRAERKTRLIAAAGDKAEAKARAKALAAGKPWTVADAATVVEKARAKAEAKYVEPEPVDESGLPDLPEGWCWTNWEHVGSCQNGRAFPSKYYCDHGTKLLRPGSLHVSGEVRWTNKNTRHMPDQWAADYPNYIVGPNELVMNLTAQSLKDEFLGRVCLTGDQERCLLNQRIGRLFPILLEPRFCLWLFKSRMFRQYVDGGLNSGSLIQHMFTSQVDKFYFPLPPEHEQAELVRRIEQALSFKTKVEDAVSEIERLAPNLNRSTLAKAFRGELVPQDPNDEPASVLLERIRAERAAAEPKKKARRSKKTATRPKREPTPPPTTASPVPPPKPVQLDLPSAAPERIPAEDEAAEVMTQLRQLLRGRGATPREQIIHALVDALGYQRVSAKLRTRIDGHLRAAVRRQILERGGGDEVRLATRRIDDYERDELVAVLRSVTRRGCVYERDELSRSVLEHLGFRRLTKDANAALKSALNVSVRRDLFERVDARRLRRRPG